MQFPSLLAFVSVVQMNWLSFSKDEIDQYLKRKPIK